MIHAIRLAVILCVICGCFISGCIPAAMQKPFVLIPPNSEWVQMKAPPSNVKEIVASADDDHFREMYGSWSYKSTWFQRGDEDYLIYFQLYSDDNCGDWTYEFKYDHGRWISIHGALGTFVVCGR